ncbi:hypothetical protein HHK36_002724 [Tetracentron sinense]|uniref:QWRF motif-containing protein 2 n=1 Tax=Tetracentron sinense TaxID=13715 RepID=A0A834ZPZ5_TETSI|nr:hypothetical protein HHK36_002724 [Tetracentron sinense]
MMVVAISAAASTDQNHTRPPLLPSERDNGVCSRRPKSREITSRYLSPFPSSSSSSSSGRCPSPLLSRPATPTAVTTPLRPAPSVIKRSLSAERRRPETPRPSTPFPDITPGNASEVPVAAKVLFTSTRSLSVSFQGESFSLPVSKTKVAPPQQNLSNGRKATPERRRTVPLRGADQTENSKPIEQHRWPGRTRQVNPLTRSLDCSGEKKKLLGSGSVVRALQQSMIYEGRRASFDGRFHPNSSNAELLKAIQIAVNANSANGYTVSSDLSVSDTESVSSSSTSGLQEIGGVARGRNGRRGISVPARFWQETNNRLRRLQEPGFPMSTGSRTTAPPKLIPLKKALTDSPLSSPRTILTSRALSSPLRGPTSLPQSPNKLLTSSTSSPSRGMPSPSRVRNATLSSHLSNTPSILSFAVDGRRGKMGENRIVDAHLLRLLYNRNLQWRFVNARADAALLIQRLTTERNLYNAWVTTSELRDSVTVKRFKLQLLRKKLKLTSILKGQMAYLEEWALLDRDHSNSLLGAIEALKASTLRLPVVGGARADIQTVEDAVGSAVDVMQAMASSICYLLSKIEEVNSLVAELASVAAKERALLDQCKGLLSTIAAMQVKDCSLRTHILQIKRVCQQV